MSALKPTLARAIQNKFAPTLRRDGFSGTGQRYWRVIGGQCQLIEVQGSRYGGKFAVNIGIQPMSVALRSGEPPNPRRIREMSCVFRRRLAAHGSDQWWDYQPNQTSMDVAACAACGVYEQVGRRQLDFMAQADSPINSLTPEDFAAGEYDFMGFGNTRALTALTLAYIRRAAGHGGQARGFAQIALDQIGDRVTGSALKPELNNLLRSL
jgi:hypothetical protein